MFERIKRLLGYGVTQDNSVPNLTEYSLYEIGDYMCRYYPDGIPNFRTDQAKQWDEYSMDVILNRKYENVREITPSMIDDLDRLLAEARDEDDVLFEVMDQNNSYISQSNVIEFRQAFFDCFNEEQIIDVIARMYANSREDFRLEQLVESESIDNTLFEYPIQQSQPTVSMVQDGTSFSMETSTFQTKTVEMQNVAGQFDLGESPIRETIEETVEVEAQMLWDALDVSDESEQFEDDDDMAYSALEAMHIIEGKLGRSDTIIVNDMDWHDVLSGCDVYVDETGVMDVPFVVADSGRLGYRVTSSPLEITRPRSLKNPYVYRMTWQGNYAITDAEMISGPK